MACGDGGSSGGGDLSPASDAGAGAGIDTNSDGADSGAATPIMADAAGAPIYFCEKGWNPHTGEAVHCGGRGAR